MRFRRSGFRLVVYSFSMCQRCDCVARTKNHPNFENRFDFAARHVKPINSIFSDSDLLDS